MDNFVQRNSQNLLQHVTDSHRGLDQEIIDFTQKTAQSKSKLEHSIYFVKFSITFCQQFIAYESASEI